MSEAVRAPGVTVTRSAADPAWQGGASDQIATVTIDNCLRLNCLSSVLVTALRDAVECLSADETVRAIVITGAGDRSFIGGADLRELGALDHDGARLYITNLHKACAAIRAAPQPVIARINGFCLGAGLEVAAACDMRAAADTAVFGMPEVHMGLPSVIEAALLPGLIGWGRTREILITGETFPAREAAEMRFLERVAPPDGLDAAIDGWLAAICRAAPHAVRAQKRLINRWQQVSVDEGIFAGIDALAEAYDTGEPQARIAAFFAAKARK